jgi:uncharacterized protein Usg
LVPDITGYGLTTASILYRLPDFKSLLQTYIWQDFDTDPDFPKLRAFLAFWEANLAGPLFSVKVMHTRLIPPGNYSLH